MFSQDDDGQQGLVLTIVFGLIAVVVSVVVGIGIYTRNQDRAPANSPVVKAAAVKAIARLSATASANLADAVDAVDAGQAASDAASVRVENGAVTFYFSSGSANLAAGAGDALREVIKVAKTGRKLVISGFHDATGDAGKNAELARQRALAVRDTLRAAGVTNQQMELKKPEQMTSSDSNAEARRVEVKLQ